MADIELTQSSTDRDKAVSQIIKALPDAVVSGPWAPAISGLKVNGSAANAGAVVLNYGSWSGAGLYRSAIAAFTHTPGNVPVEESEFIVSLPTIAGYTVQDFYGHGQVSYLEYDSEGHYFGDVTAGVNLWPTESQAPYSEGTVDTVFYDSTAATSYKRIITLTIHFKLAST